MRRSIQLTINGEPHEVPADLTIDALVAHLGLIAVRVAVEQNRRVVRRAEWMAQTVAAGDQIEIVHFMGGG